MKQQFSEQSCSRLCLTLGSASPLAIRSTTYCVPCDGQTALLSRLPLGALVTPLAKRNAGEVSEICRITYKKCRTSIWIWINVCGSRSPCQCAKSRSALRDVDGVEPQCVRQWAGWTVVRGFTAPSVGNSVKVQFNCEPLSPRAPYCSKGSLYSHYRIIKQYYKYINWIIIH